MSPVLAPSPIRFSAVALSTALNPSGDTSISVLGSKHRGLYQPPKLLGDYFVRMGPFKINSIDEVILNNEQGQKIRLGRHPLAGALTRMLDITQSPADQKGFEATAAMGLRYIIWAFSQQKWWLSRQPKLTELQQLLLKRVAQESVDLTSASRNSARVPLPSIAEPAIAIHHDQDSSITGSMRFSVKTHLPYQPFAEVSFWNETVGHLLKNKTDMD